MQITMIATGSRGDVQPYVALGQGLQKAGNSVRFVTHENFSGLVNAYGLEFWAVEGDVQAVAQSDAMVRLVNQGNFLKLMRQMAKEAEKGALHLAQTGLAACQGTDLVLAGLGGLHTGFALSEKLGIPLVQAYYAPFTPTREFPSVLVPRLPAWLKGSLNRVSHHLTRQVMWQGFRSADQRARREVFGLPPAPFAGPLYAKNLAGMPVLYGFSPVVIPPPKDWGTDVHVTGYWFLDVEDGWAPPTGLVEFLAAGPPPIFIGFGSMSNRDPGEMAALVSEALERSSQRAVVQAGWGGLKDIASPDRVCSVDSVPHAWLFPRMAAVVHHGGAGTTSAGLRAGVPSIIVPFFGDQPFWGQRVHDLGVGPAPLPRQKLTAERLAKAIQQAVGDPQMRLRAERLGAAIRSENGTARAVEIIQNI